MKPQHLLIASGVLALSACATAPDKIQASAVNADAYSEWSCGRLDAEQMQTTANLASLERAQKRARTVDTIGVALVFVPVSSLLGGSHKQEIADRKGELAAMNVQAKSRCRGAAEPVAERDALVQLTKRAAIDPSPRP